MPPKVSTAEAIDSQPHSGEGIKDGGLSKVQKGSGKITTLRVVSVNQDPNYPSYLKGNFPSQELDWGD